MNRRTTSMIGAKIAQHSCLYLDLKLELAILGDPIRCLEQVIQGI